MTLDDTAPEEAPALIKIDVEGFETNVIAGGRNTLSRARVVIMELNGSGKRYGFEDSELAEKMKELGFSPCGYAPSERRLFPTNPLKGTGNVIFVRDREAPQERVASGPTYSVWGSQV